MYGNPAHGCFLQYDRPDHIYTADNSDSASAAVAVTLSVNRSLTYHILQLSSALSLSGSKNSRSTQCKNSYFSECDPRGWVIGNVVLFVRDKAFIVYQSISGESVRLKDERTVFLVEFTLDDLKLSFVYPYYAELGV